MFPDELSSHVIRLGGIYAKPCFNSSIDKIWASGGKGDIHFKVKCEGLSRTI